MDREVKSDGATQEARDELSETRDRYLRLAADFDNFKKRARQGQQHAAERAAAAAAEKLLPAVDDAELAMQHVPEGTDEKWLTGLGLMLQKLRDGMAAIGVEPIDALGEPFDPRLHEAVGTVDTTEYPEGTVAMVLRRGYRIGGRVLRPSLVKVARRPEQPAREPAPGEPT